VFVVLTGLGEPGEIVDHVFFGNAHHHGQCIGLTQEGLRILRE
jgi:hypothetical protein